MNEISIILDDKNYKDTDTKYIRKAVRGIILKNDFIALVKSDVEGYYKIPGGGVNENENEEDALIREIKEETGLNGIKSTIVRIGSIIEKRKDIFVKDQMFIQTSIIFKLDVDDSVPSPLKLENYEKELKYHLEWVKLEYAIKQNDIIGNLHGSRFIERDTDILRRIRNKSI